MEIARLFAKLWVAVCLCAGADALAAAFASGADPWGAAGAMALCTLLFAAMGALFSGGYGVLSGYAGWSAFKSFDPAHLIPCFDDAVFASFVALGFLVQTFLAPHLMSGPVADGLEAAIYAIVPGHRALVGIARPCLCDGGRLFASAFSWFLALIYFCSTLSRIRMAAGLVRLRRARRADALAGRPSALFVGISAIVFIQLFYAGSGYALLPCSMLTGVTGALIAGLAPLATAYVAIAALAALVACGDEK